MSIPNSGYIYETTQFIGYLSGALQLHEHSKKTRQLNVWFFNVY